MAEHWAKTKKMILIVFCPRLISLTSRTGVFQNEVFIVEPIAINAFSAGAISLGEIPTLNHKLRNDAMEFAPFVPKP